MSEQKHRRGLARLIFAFLTLPAVAHAQDATPEDLIAALREGGHVVYIRHAQTESDYADQVNADPQNCATQRVLSRTGWQQARDIGAGFERLEIPVAEVLSSQYCRAWQTADLAFGGTEEVEALNFLPFEDYDDAQVRQMQDRVTPLLTQDLPASGNRVIVAHDDPFEAVTGIYPEPQGAAYVLRIDGETVEVLGKIDPDAWPDL
ncbi:histidine phosphatase family protein [Jannaschia sp. S6380]|uniref:histidine phosphatase family protein n=1 Tax=Jannaschia sp. S6380 TaxID=2926408 RepID=UPI001FF665D3|nr:histidine phosphatase family protein [Jannaschia sp. S6380]MCK0169153.1 histidine phosphatase family protein [Jannaschia sp. S6380]